MSDQRVSEADYRALHGDKKEEAKQEPMKFQPLTQEQVNPSHLTETDQPRS